MSLIEFVYLGPLYSFLPSHLVLIPFDPSLTCCFERRDPLRVERITLDLNLFLGAQDLSLFSSFIPSFPRIFSPILLRDCLVCKWCYSLSWESGLYISYVLFLFLLISSLFLNTFEYRLRWRLYLEKRERGWWTPYLCGIFISFLPSLSLFSSPWKSLMVSGKLYILASRADFTPVFLAQKRRNHTLILSRYLLLQKQGLPLYPEFSSNILWSLTSFLSRCVKTERKEGSKEKAISLLYLLRNSLSDTIRFNKKKNCTLFCKRNRGETDSLI